ncbi:MAG TPA: ATP-grasp domain-containing protein [bacterium]|nr:ATP-grasp domain-containing protein [bacterium]
MDRVLLLMGTQTYRATDFLEAARRIGVEVVVGLDRPDPLEALHTGGVVSLDFQALDGATAEIGRLHAAQPLQAVVSVDDSATVLAARACAALGLPTNPEEGAVASRNKLVFREITQAAGLRSPWFRAWPLSAEPEALAAQVPYPCVLKPLFLNASRGVIRADDAAGFVAAFRRIARLLDDPDLQVAGGELAGQVLVESFMPGQEVALEGMIRDGEFQLLAFFDKPDPLDGPFFEETLFVTPSRHPADVQRRALAVAAAGARALGLRTGPAHAELRLDGGEPYLLEIATRSIGGHCSRTLRFSSGMSLEELILRQALGQPPTDAQREASAAGVLMIPVPAGGQLEAVHGLEAARGVPGITEIEISIPLTQAVVPWPEGHRYLGFIFAKGERPEQVEAALRTAHSHLRFDIHADTETSACAS